MDAARKKDGAKPAVAGKKFEGTGYRLEDPDHLDTSWEAGPWNVSASHRYSGKGEAAIYAADSPKTALAEVKHWSDPTGRISMKTKIKLDNALDLSDPSTRKALDIDLSEITSDSYLKTQEIAKWARANDFDGIIAPSARNINGNNIVIFK